jgi:hypothetical protein
VSEGGFLAIGRPSCYNPRITDPEASLIEFDYNPEQDFVHARASGIVTDQDVIGFLVGVLRHKAVSSATRILYDASRAEGNELSQAGYDGHAELFALHFDRCVNMRIAFYAPREDQFDRLTEVIQSLGKLPLQTRLFAELPIARLWLSAVGAEHG